MTACERVDCSAPAAGTADAAHYADAPARLCAPHGDEIARAYRGLVTFTPDAPSPALDRAAWTVVRHRGGDYLRADTGGVQVIADAIRGDIDVDSLPGTLITPDESRTLAARLVEAAAFVDGGPA